MKNAISVLAVTFVVSWPNGTNLKPVPCPVRQPSKIMCFESEEKRAEREFKFKEAAEEFKKVLEDSKIADVAITEKK